MDRQCLFFILTCFLLGATGCRKVDHRNSFGYFDDQTKRSLAMNYQVQAGPAQRFVAATHKIDVIAPESELEKSWEALVTFCGTIQCEVVSSNITTTVEDSTPSGSIALRVAPEDSNKLFTQVQKLGKITQHTILREDKTTDVIDTDAKIKNLTSFRDSLRAMLAKPSATVKDLVDIQQQLTETQSQLDSETAQRKVLANETEKIAVEFSFRVQRTTGNAAAMRQIWNALRESGSILADSTAALITVIGAVIPWLILIVPAVWLVRMIWRRLRRNRTITPPLSSATS
jgi:hypothetical protein